MDIAGAELFPAIHDDAVIGFAETRSFGYDFGVLVEDDLTDGFDSAWRHGLVFFFVNEQNQSYHFS